MCLSLAGGCCLTSGAWDDYQELWLPRAIQPGTPGARVSSGLSHLPRSLPLVGHPPPSSRQVTRGPIGVVSCPPKGFGLNSIFLLFGHFQPT